MNDRFVGFALLHEINVPCLVAPYSLVVLSKSSIPVMYIAASTVGELASKATYKRRPAASILERSSVRAMKDFPVEFGLYRLALVGDIAEPRPDSGGSKLKDTP